MYANVVNLPNEVSWDVDVAQCVDSSPPWFIRPGNKSESKTLNVLIPKFMIKHLSVSQAVSRDVGHHK